MNRTRVLVVAKAPVAGLAKTRLSPPATPEQAAGIAAAALLDTMDSVGDAVRRMPGSDVVVALTGELSAARCAAEIRAALACATVVAQRGKTFADRLVAAHRDTVDGGSGVLQIGMDTPQVNAELLTDSVRTLGENGTDAVLGPAADGGWWALGLRDPRAAEVLRDVPMSTADTYEATMGALREHGLRVRVLPELSDVDTMSDATLVARQVPGSRFAAAVRAVTVPAEAGR